jgi:hypothetical protein
MSKQVAAVLLIVYWSGFVGAGVGLDGDGPDGFHFWHIPAAALWPVWIPALFVHDIAMRKS